MKNLDEIKIQDRALKREKNVEVMQYVRAIIRNDELDKILKKRSFRDGQNELWNSHADIDAMTCDEDVVYQVLKAKASQYIEDRKNVVLLKKICRELPALKEINELCVTDKMHLILIAHELCPSINFAVSFFEYADVVMAFDKWSRRFFFNSKGMSYFKDCLRSIFFKLAGQEGNLFYGIKIRRSNLHDMDIMEFVISILKEKNRIKQCKIFTEFSAHILYNKESPYEIVRNLTNDHLLEIGMEDFVIKCNIFRCMHDSHDILDITAIVKIKKENEQIESIKISAGYCKECKIFFILNTTYQQLTKMGIVLCKVLDEKEYLKNDYLNGTKLAQKSLLMQYGYNVSQVCDISDKKRQDILKFIIDNKILSKNEVISYLNFFISQKQGISNMGQAISKWKKDREFIEKYHIEKYEEVEIKSIHYT